MSVVDSKEYSATSLKLESLADGIKKHANEPDYPKKLKEKEVRDLRQGLEDDRETYTTLQAKADQAGEKYKGRLRQCVVTIAEDKSSVQGYHGKYSEFLKDYGFPVPKKGGRKGPRPKQPPAPPKA